MNKAQIMALFDQDQRKDITYPGVRREAFPNLVRSIDATGQDGFISFSQLTEADVEDAISEQISYFESIGQDFEWKLYDYDQPPDLKERLAARGFLIEEAESVMVLALEEAPEILWKPVTHDVRRVKVQEQIQDIVRMEEEVWEEDFSGLGRFLEDALGNYPDRMSIYVAYASERPVSAAWVYFPEGSQFGSLWGGSTIKEFRKQGLYTALLAARAQEASERGRRYLTVDASDMSRPILERYNFQKIATSFPCKWKVKSKAST